MLLHFVVQDRFQSSCCEPPAHIGHGLLTHIESARQFSGTPPLCRFEQEASPGEGTGVGFASMHKSLQAGTFFLGQGHG